MTDITGSRSGHDDDHGWINPTGFEEVDTDDEIDEGALGDGS